MEKKSRGEDEVPEEAVVGGRGCESTFLGGRKDVRGDSSGYENWN